jgi:hypothetical protein
MYKLIIFILTYPGQEAINRMAKKEKPKEKPKPKK